MPRKLYLSFSLDDDFVEEYKDRPVDWGFPCGGGNSLGQITFMRTYSRLKEDGSKERWYETVRRVVEGTYSIQKDWCEDRRIPWNERKAQRSAQEMYDRIFTMKFTPPGRGLWMMGTEFTHTRKDSTALQNCAFISTKDGLIGAATFLMEASMLGVGVGFDVEGAGKQEIFQPKHSENSLYIGYRPQGLGTEVFSDDMDLWHTFDPNKGRVIIEDTREGWTDSVRALLESYLRPRYAPIDFNYSGLRLEGEPIKGFGGTSSGPEPLIRLHNSIRDIFEGREGEKLTIRDIVDVMNLIGKCVVAGNVRRTAEIALGPVDEEFLNLKNYRFDEDEGGYVADHPVAEGRWGHGWTSNNSVLATAGETDYEEIQENAIKTGEPGVFWLENCRNYGRMIDPLRNHDHRVMGLNPCLSSDNWVRTTNGMKKVGNLIDRPFWAVVNGKAHYSSEGFFQTGHKEIYQLNTKEGYSLKLTNDHQVHTPDRGKMPVGELQAGDEININNHRGVHYWRGSGGTTDEGYLLGAFVGDGGWESVPVVKVWNKDEGSEGIESRILDASSSQRRRSDWDGWRDHGRGYKVLSLASTFLNDWGLDYKEKKITNRMLQASSGFYKGFLSGLFDADGHVENRDGQGLNVRLSSVSREMLETVQRMLLQLGIRSSIYTGHPARTKEMPGGVYECRPTWRLVISSSDTREFHNRIGFAHIAKNEKLDSGINSMTRGFNDQPWIVRFESLEYVGQEPVYDCTVEDIHLYDANGLLVANCGEQPLESGEMCTLVETYPTRAESKEDYLRTLKFAYLYGKTVTLLPTHWPETNSIMQRNRRIGCSMSGVADFLTDNSIGALKEWMDDGYQEIQNWDKTYSEWLTVRESIKTTTIKPSGTVSLLAGASPGVHFPTRRTYIRRMRFKPSHPLVDEAAKAGYHVEPDMNDPDGTVVVEFPVQGSEARTEEEVSVWEKVALAATAQMYWSDNGVSCTATFDPKTESDQLAPILRAYEDNLKAMSFNAITTEGNYPQLPYESIPLEEVKNMQEGIKVMNMEKIYTGEEAEGSLYCTTDKCEI